MAVLVLVLVLVLLLMMMLMLMMMMMMWTFMFFPTFAAIRIRSLPPMASASTLSPWTHTEARGEAEAQPVMDWVQETKTCRPSKRVRESCTSTPGVGVLIIYLSDSHL